MDTNHWNRLKATALWLWGALVWSLRTALVIVIGALFLIRQVVYGTLSLMMPADRVDRMGRSFADSVVDGLADIDDEDDHADDNNSSLSPQWSCWNDYKHTNRWG